MVLADRYYYTLIARAAVRGIDRKYLSGIYSAAPEPDLTFFLDVSPQVAFEREFKKSQAISFWEAGRDLNISPDLYESFTVYHKRIRKEFDRLAKTHDFTRLDGEAPIPQVNRMLRKHVAKFLGISSTAYQPSSGLIHLWR